MGSTGISTESWEIAAADHENRRQLHVVSRGIENSKERRDKLCMGCKERMPAEKSSNSPSDIASVYNIL